MFLLYYLLESKITAPIAAIPTASDMLIVKADDYGLFISLARGFGNPISVDSLFRYNPVSWGLEIHSKIYLFVIKAY